MTLEQVAAIVCATLERHGVRVVLSGGSVVTIYSNNAYQSYDLDFVHLGLARRVDPAMEELGFFRQGRHWRHANTRYWVEFPAGPVGIGNATITEFAERRTPHGLLRLLAPTECVMDRLASFYHANDAQCLDQAVAVARNHTVDMERIKRWSREEGAGSKLREFLDKLESTPSPESTD